MKYKKPYKSLKLKKHMRKEGVIVFFVFSLILLSTFVLAVDNETNSTNTTVSGTTTTTTTTTQNLSKLEKGFECLEAELKADCSGATTIQELALAVLSSPESVADECLARLENSRNSEGCFGSGCSIRDTALAILALDHAGKDTTLSEEWLIKQNKTATDLIWYLEQDSAQATQCNLDYNSNKYIFNVNENKRIDKSAGPCFSLAQSNFWFQLSQGCYDMDFLLSCDEDYVATWIYKTQNSQTFYVLSNTRGMPAFGQMPLTLSSRCFGSTGCNFEDTAWAALALQKTGHDVDAFIPYVVASVDVNARYLPEAFAHMLVEYSEYGTKLIQKQRLNYWEAENTAYNRYYDTSLALIALYDSSSEQVLKSREWLLFSQEASGCWNNKNIKDTAMILWAMENKAFTGDLNVGPTTYCTEANYFCIRDSDCPSDEVLDNFYCPSLGSACCKNENLKTCDEYGGQVCSSGEVCFGTEREASDTGYCCLSSCVDENTNTEPECEERGYVCKSDCSDTQEEVSLGCDGTDVCCKSKDALASSSFPWWIIWLILILIVLGIIIWFFRDKLRLWWFKMKSKFKKDKGKGSSSGPGYPPRGMPPRPGFPPIRRPMPLINVMPPRQMRRRPMPGRSEGPMDDVFKKLKDMSS